MSEKNTTYTLLYDGSCPFCRNQAAIVAQFDTFGRIERLDINSDQARERFPQITPQAAQRELHLATPEGHTLYRGAEAVRKTLMLLPMLRLPGLMMHLPGAMAMAKPMYRLVARHRHLFGGRSEPCDDGTCERS